MAKKKKREEPSGPAGAPEWVVTFTDMISLLVTFFVLLMTFSSMDTYEAMKVDSFLPGKRGIKSSKGYDLVPPGEADILSAANIRRGGPRPHTRPPDQLPEDIEEIGRVAQENEQEVDFSDVSDGLVIQFGEEECFAPGSAEVSPQLEEALVQLAGVLENYPHLVVVEGFTDGAFQATPEYPDEDSLSLARAQAAATVMLSRSAMNPDLVQIAGLGSTHPRADDVSPGGRRLNRRVRVRVLSLSKSRAQHLEAQQKEGLR
ncbi:MAG TPA: hypothetical protein ENJ09_16195 [Planctomycetes bacterium]|nr:hypothetical protein [Planctomycetota bacterium]